jgi:hypothetical protein
MYFIRIVAIISFSVATLTWAQNKKTTISFKYYTHDFGVIKEDGGLQSYEFVFENIGNTPLQIKNVQASCGCTVPEWSKDAVMTGSTGKIKVEFNPNNKPGPFNKSLIVYTNATNETVMLNVTGKVIPKPRKPSDDFPDLVGNLRMVSRYMNLGDMTTEKPCTKVFNIYNQSDTSISILSVNSNLQFATVSISSPILLPKSKHKISIEYNPAKKNDFGYVQDKIELVTSDKLVPVKSIYITGIISKFFPKYTEEELKTQPKFQIDKLSHDFGLIKQGDKLTTLFTITNSGKDMLVIYKVKPSCGCTITNLEKKMIANGESTKLSITFDSQGKEGVQEKHINIYTNDPTNFNPIITLKAKIQKNL